MNNFKFIKLCQGSKIPIKNESFKDAKPLDKIDTKKYNVGLVAGINNLLILDIDIKDGGLIEWNKYKKDHFDPYTMKQETPSGGFHYVFLHKSTKYTPEQVELIDRLKNKSKYRGFGLDIRKNNGYIVFSPSSRVIDGETKPYKLLNILEPSEIPLTLLNWLLEFETQEKEAINNNLVLVKNIKQVKEILSNFDEVNSKLWFNITTALKNLIHKYNNIDEEELKTVWKEWSKTQDNYNKKNNVKIWDSITSNINMNFVILQHNKNRDTTQLSILPLECFKPLMDTKTEIKTIEMKNKYIFDNEYKGEQFNFNIFEQHDTIIIKSTTGTGKTSNTANHIKKYMEDKPHLKVLSLIDRICLSYQHLDSFNKAGLKMVSYQDKNKNIEDDNIIICLNSLVLYSKYDKEFFKNYIVYIDEITSFLFSLTHNDTLNHVLKMVYVVLMRIINNCHKIIVSDATITENTFSFLDKRKGEKVFINNVFKKYEGVKAYKINDENYFLTLLKKHVSENKYFLFGCDSKNITNKFYSELKTDNKLKFTSDEKVQIKDASTEFKNKFIVYSPSITTGIDFSINEPQDVFLYIKGSSITPEASFQQLSRTRNIKNVYFYINETSSKPAKYNSLDEVKTFYKEVCSTHSKLYDLCGVVTDDENGFIFNENAFFNIFSFNEYIIDIFNTNKKQHFINILTENKFIIKEQGKKMKLNIKTEIEINERVGKEKEKKFNETISGTNIDEVIKKRLEFLQITDEETANEYREIIIDPFKLNDYLNFLRLLKDEQYIQNKIRKEKSNLTEYKAVYTNYYKMILLGQLEAEMKIERFQLDKIKGDKPFKISEDLNKKINSSFRCDEFPITFNECILYYVNKIKHLTGFISIINSTQIQEDGKRERHYNINTNVFSKYLKLYDITTGDRKNVIKCSLLEELKRIQAEKNVEKDVENNIDVIEYFEFPDMQGLDFGMPSNGIKEVL